MEELPMSRVAKRIKKNKEPFQGITRERILGREALNVSLGSSLPYIFGQTTNRLPNAIPTLIAFATNKPQNCFLPTFILNPRWITRLSNTVLIAVANRIISF
jgi:hypothetical protein